MRSGVGAAVRGAPPTGAETTAVPRTAPQRRAALRRACLRAMARLDGVAEPSLEECDAAPRGGTLRDAYWALRPDARPSWEPAPPAPPPPWEPAHAWALVVALGGALFGGWVDPAAGTGGGAAVWLFGMVLLGLDRVLWGLEPAMPPLRRRLAATALTLEAAVALWGETLVGRPALTLALAGVATSGWVGLLSHERTADDAAGRSSPPDRTEELPRAADLIER